jgi:hypothetical protein
MSDRLLNLNAAILRGSEGELVFVRVYVEPKMLEEVLDALAEAPFPVNPQIRHLKPLTLIEFPAYEPHVSAIRELLETGQLGTVRIEVSSALAAIQ